MEPDSDSVIRAACDAKAARMIEGMREAWELHADDCDRPPNAILLNPANYDLIGWDEALGLPVLPDPRVPADKFRIHCGVCGGQIGAVPVWWDQDGNAYVETRRVVGQRDPGASIAACEAA